MPRVKSLLCRVRSSLARKFTLFSPLLAHLFFLHCRKLKLIKFDPKKFLSTINGGRKIETFARKQTILAQGSSSDAVFYIQKGKVKLTVVSEIGKEATIGILNEGDFFGEGCLTGQPLRLCSATAMTDCSVMKIDKKSMNDVLHREPAFSDMFVGYLLARNIRYEEDLVDQLFNSSEKRLARILLLLAHFGKEGKQGSLMEQCSMISTSWWNIVNKCTTPKPLSIMIQNPKSLIHPTLRQLFDQFAWLPSDGSFRLSGGADSPRSVESHRFFPKRASSALLLLLEAMCQ
jgi:CRP-like cAMP-binding protein